MPVLNVNTNEVIKYTVKLEQLTRSAFPSAIRGALNKAVYDVKTKTMPEKTLQEFERREPNFFKANSRFENAKGFDINSMKATVGFVETALKDKPNYAVQELEQQEEGGTIHHKSFIALPGARVANSFSKATRANARLKKIKKMVNGKESRGANWEQRAIKGAVFAGKGGLLLMPGRKGSVLWRITSIRREGRNTQFTKTKLYSFTKNRSVKVHATHFMKEASERTAKKMEMFYIAEAKRQIEKYYK
jgi:hypothetical protein